MHVLMVMLAVSVTRYTIVLNCVWSYGALAAHNRGKICMHALAHGNSNLVLLHVPAKRRGRSQAAYHTVWSTYMHLAESQCAAW